MQQENFYQVSPENGIFQKSEKKQFFVSKALNTVSPAVLSASSLIIVYQFSLGMLYYILLPLAILSVYYLIWLSFRISRLQYDNQKMSDKIDVVMQQNRKLYENTNLQKITLEPLKLGESEIYIKYKKLSIDFLSDFLREYEHFYLLLYGVLNTKIRLDDYYEKEKFATSKFIESVKTVIKGKPEHILVLDHIHTGESIKLRVGTTVKLNWYAKGGPYLDIPKGWYTFIIASRFLAIAAGSGIATCAAVLEIMKYREEISQPYSEKQLFIDENAYYISKELENLPDYIKDEISDSTNKILELTIRNDNIQEFKLRIER